MLFLEGQSAYFLLWSEAIVDSDIVGPPGLDKLLLIFSHEVCVLDRFEYGIVYSDILFGALLLTVASLL